MSNTIVMGWNRAVPGREAHSMELFQSTVAFWTKQQQNGTIQSFEPVFLSAHGGDMNGFFIIKGEPAKLDALEHNLDYIKLVMDAQLALQGFGTIRSYSGDRATELMGEWGKLLQKYA